MTNTTLLILGSSILIPPPPSPLPSSPLSLPHHYHSINPKTKLSPAKPPPPPPSSSAASCSSHPRPLLSTVRWDLDSRLNYYAVLASKLAHDGRLEDLLMIAESVVVAGVKPSEFVALLNLELVSEGIASMIGDRKVQSVIQVLSGVEKLGISPVELFDGFGAKALARELRRLVKCGEVEEVVELMEVLAGFHFSIDELMEPLEIIRTCVNKQNPNVAIRYALVSTHADLLFCNIIIEFGKKGDLVSALTVFEASKHSFGGPNMYVYRTMIDVCGLCGKHLQSRSIYKDLMAQKVTPNLYVFNSLMSVNACDLSYAMDIFKHMQNLGVAADMASYNILLKSCCLAARVDLAQDIYRDILYLESKGSLKLDVFTYSTIVKIFADAKMWQMALEIKGKMQAAGVTPNTITWSSLISACANAGLVDQAFRFFEEMVLAGCVPNSQCCNVLLHACVEARQYDRAFRLFQSWKKNSSQKAFIDYHRKTDRNIYDDHKCKNNNTSTPNATSDSYGLQFAVKIPFKPTTSTYNILMKACGTDHHRAKALLDEMKTVGLSPNQISWSTLIGVCGGSGNVKGAMQILKTMREAGVQPDVIAYTAAIKVCVENKDLKFAFSLFSEMKRYQIKPNLVTYNTLLRARSRYGSLQEVQQCLAIYQDMRRAGYKPNDYYLKQLIEEWCEGIIQDNHHYQGQLDSSNRSDLGGPQSLLLEKVAAHLQNSNSETRAISVDLRGLTKVEARIVVLAVLRMIKENYIPGDSIKDDMWIILGIQEIGAVAAKHKFDVKDAIVKLLRDDLGLEVLLAGPRIPTERKVNSESPFNPHLDNALGRNGLPTQSTSPTRRPAVLQRLKVSRRSLYRWLQRRSSGSQRQTISHPHNNNFVDEKTIRS